MYFRPLNEIACRQTHEHSVEGSSAHGELFPLRYLSPKYKIRIQTVTLLRRFHYYNVLPLLSECSRVAEEVSLRKLI